MRETPSALEASVDSSMRVAKGAGSTTRLVSYFQEMTHGTYTCLGLLRLCVHCTLGCPKKNKNSVIGEVIIK